MADPATAFDPGGDVTTPTVLTFGHGTAGAAQITALLTGAGVRRLVDVRTAPGSRHNPDSAREAMAHWLPEAGIGYAWEPRLGGWRHATGDPLDVALRVASFRSYAVYMRTPEFAAAVDDLLVTAAQAQVAIMCAETVWWRCHRKLISDYLMLVRGVPVRHLMHDGKLRAHRPTAEARVAGKGLIYDGPPPPG